MIFTVLFFFFSSRRRHTRCYRDWSSDVCSSDLEAVGGERGPREFGENLPDAGMRGGDLASIDRLHVYIDLALVRPQGIGPQLGPPGALRHGLHRGNFQ